MRCRSGDALDVTAETKTPLRGLLNGALTVCSPDADLVEQVLVWQRSSILRCYTGADLMPAIEQNCFGRDHHLIGRRSRCSAGASRFKTHWLPAARATCVI